MNDEFAFAHYVPSMFRVYFTRGGGKLKFPVPFYIRKNSVVVRNWKEAEELAKDRGCRLVGRY
jgi:hypothetical protein